MNFEVLIPITLFICIVYAIKVVVDARTRAKLIANNASEELMQALLAGEEHNRRHGSLRWGIVLTALAAMLGALFILDDPIFNGLAISLIFGILVSTALTLVLIPILYFSYRSRKQRA